MLLALALALPSRPADANIRAINGVTKLVEWVVSLFKAPDIPTGWRPRGPRTLGPEPTPAANWERLPPELRAAVEKFWIEHGPPGAALQVLGQRAQFRVVFEGERVARAELESLRAGLRDVLYELQGNAELDPEEDRYLLAGAKVQQAIITVVKLRTAYRIGFRSLHPAFTIGIAIDVFDASGLDDAAARQLQCETEQNYTTKQVCEFVAFAADVFKLAVDDMLANRSK